MVAGASKLTSTPAFVVTPTIRNGDEGAAGPATAARCLTVHAAISATVAMVKVVNHRFMITSSYDRRVKTPTFMKLVDHQNILVSLGRNHGAARERESPSGRPRQSSCRLHFLYSLLDSG